MVQNGALCIGLGGYCDHQKNGVGFTGDEFRTCALDLNLKGSTRPPHTVAGKGTDDVRIILRYHIRRIFLPWGYPLLT